MRDLRLEHYIRKANSTPEEESKIVVIAERIVKGFREETPEWEPDYDNLFEELDELSEEYKIAEALYHLGLWEVQNGFENGARKAQSKFREAAEEAIEKEWFNVAIYSYLLSAELDRELNWPDRLQTDTRLVVCIFRNNWSDLSRNTQMEVVSSIPYLLSGVKKETTKIVSKKMDTIAERAHDNGYYELERHLIDKLLEIGEVPKEELENRLITSYEGQISNEGRVRNQKAYLLQEGLTRCSSFLNFPQKNEWKAAVREATKRSIPEMGKYENKLSEEDAKELEKAIDNIVDRASQIAEKHSRIHAVYYLLSERTFLPNVESQRDSESVNRLELVQTRSITSEGYSIPEKEDTERSSGYKAKIQLRNQILTQVLSRAIERWIITPTDLLLYLDTIDSISEHDRAYLTDMIIAHFEGRYSESIHIGVARLEGAIATQMKEKGIETSSIQDGYQKPLSLPRLLSILEEQGVSKDIIEYLRYWYCDLSGQQIRNKIAHGRSSYKLASWGISLIVLYDILLTVGILEEELRYYPE